MAKKARPRPELFLSHATRDHGFTARLAVVLRGHGLSVWYSSTDLVGGQEWQEEIGKALQRCNWFVLVLSPSAVASRWVKRELNCALLHERFDGAIVPVLRKRCDLEALSWTLPALHAVDFTADFDRGCQSLLRVWGLEYGPDAATD